MSFLLDVNLLCLQQKPRQNYSTKCIKAQESVAGNCHVPSFLKWFMYCDLQILHEASAGLFRFQLWVFQRRRVDALTTSTVKICQILPGIPKAWSQLQCHRYVLLSELWGFESQLVPQSSLSTWFPFFAVRLEQFTDIAVRTHWAGLDKADIGIFGSTTMAVPSFVRFASIHVFVSHLHSLCYAKQHETTRGPTQPFKLYSKKQDCVIVYHVFSFCRSQSLHSCGNFRWGRGHHSGDWLDRQATFRSRQGSILSYIYLGGFLRTHSEWLSIIIVYI